MNNRVQFCAVSSVETVIKKLARAKIAVYGVKKHQSLTYFSVDEEYVKKVFAIFAHPCYNIVIRRKSFKMRAKAFAARRFGLIIGAAAFIAICALADGFVLSVKVTGSGAYLKDRVNAIARECGVVPFTPCLGFDGQELSARVLAMPSVTFCSVQRKGSYLIIDVRTQDDFISRAPRRDFKAEGDGVIKRIVALCGTAEKAEGQAVKDGETLIGAYEIHGDGEKKPCIPVGFAEIEKSATLTYYADKESEENRKAALSGCALYSSAVTGSEVKIAPCGDGVNYTVNFTYLITQSVNME